MSITYVYGFKKMTYIAFLVIFLELIVLIMDLNMLNKIRKIHKIPAKGTSKKCAAESLVPSLSSPFALSSCVQRRLYTS